MEIYLIEGEDIYIKDKYLANIKAKQKDIQKGINYILCDKPDIDELIYEINIPSFLSKEKLIIVTNSNIFKSSYTDGEKLLKTLEENSEMYDGITLVLIEDKNILSTNKIKKYISKNGKILKCDKPKKNDIKDEIFSIAKNNEIYISFEDIYYLIENVGEDLSLNINEFNKLIHFVKQTQINKYKINKEIIDKIVIKNSDAKMYEITAKIENYDRKNAIKIINENFNDQSSILGVISYMYGYFLDIYLCYICDKEKKDAVSELGIAPNRTFVIQNYRKMYNRLGIEKIINILKELSEIDEKTKTESIDNILMIKSLIMTIC